MTAEEEDYVDPDLPPASSWVSRELVQAVLGCLVVTAFAGLVVWTAYWLD